MIEVRAKRKAKAKPERRNSVHLNEHVILPLNQTVIKLLVLAICMFSILALAGCSRVNKENYDKIEIGMSYEEVDGVLGKPNTCEAPVLIYSTVPFYSLRPFSFFFLLLLPTCQKVAPLLLNNVI
jgi:hypothetical protein